MLWKFPLQWPEKIWRRGGGQGTLKENIRGSGGWRRALEKRWWRLEENIKEEVEAGGTH